MPSVCPFCGSTVTPGRDAQGQLVCPSCANTGRVPPTPAPWGTPSTADAPPVAASGGAAAAPAPGVHPFHGGPGAPHAAQNAKGAVPSLVFGILAFVVWFLGIVFAPLAIVLGSRAKQRIAESGGTLRGEGLAKAGRVLGWVWVGLVIPMVLLASVVFVLVSDLGATATADIVDEQATIPPGEALMQGFVVFTRSTTVDYTVDVEGEGVVDAGLYPVEDANDPQPTSLDGWAEASGSHLEESAVLERGSYALLVSCESASPCTVRYTIATRDA